MPRGFRGISDLRSVQWSNQLHWDVIFVNPVLEGQTADEIKERGVPYPFNEWFPATSVEDQTADLELYSLDTPFKPLKFPMTGGSKTIKLTFVDTAAHLLHSFFETWIEKTIQNERQYIATIQESVKYMQVRRLNPDRSIISNLTKTYLVIPQSSLNYEGTDKPDPNSYSVTFVKVGKASNSVVSNV